LQVQKNRRDAQPGNGAQQPAQVVARSAQHRMQRVTVGALEPAALQSVVVLGMTDGRLDGLAPAQPAALEFRQALDLAAVDELHGCRRASR